MKFDEAIKNYLIEVEDIYTLDNLAKSDINKILSDIDLSRDEAREGFELVYLDVDKFDKLWKDSGDPTYIDYDSAEHKYKDAIKFFLLTPEERYEQYKATHINAPVVDVADDAIGVLQGRHRYKVLRDIGVEKIPVAMNQSSIEKAKELGII